MTKNVEVKQLEKIQKPKKKNKGVKRIFFGFIAFMMLKSCMGSDEVEKEKEVKAQEPKTEEVQEEVEKEEPVKEEVQYTTEKSFIQNDPSSYSGKSVYEISIHGTFDLNSSTLKQEAMMILNKEAEIGLKEQPTSVMIRVFIYQGEGYDYLPIAVGTYDVAGSNVVLRELQDKARFPIFNQLNK
jgi:hypothetical protein